MFSFAETLALPQSLIPYAASKALAEHAPAVLETASYAFDFQDFVADGLASMRTLDKQHPIIGHNWHGAEKRPVTYTVEQGWVEIEWSGEHVEIVRLEWESGSSTTHRTFILAATMDLALRFFRAVCAYTTRTVGEEILVYEDGSFEKSPELFAAIRASTFDTLVLLPETAAALRSDFRAFFDARDTFAKYGVPWKRGALFMGSPGNGKTHAVKALINDLQKPCLYVKSLKARGVTDHAALRSIFERAREMAPCILVLEDLDTLVDEGNRSFFLNELDGFADNHGIVTLATTNYPQQLDPALVDRPSRFDRTYAFPLPDLIRRAAYVSRWSERLDPELRLTGGGVDRIAELTAGFSFAYLKELGVASLLDFIRAPGPMDGICETQAKKLAVHVARGKCGL